MAHVFDVEPAGANSGSNLGWKARRLEEHENHGQQNEKEIREHTCEIFQYTAQEVDQFPGLEHVEEVKGFAGSMSRASNQVEADLNQTVEPSLVLGRKGRELVDRSPDNRSEARKHAANKTMTISHDGETDRDPAFGMSAKKPPGCR